MDSNDLRSKIDRAVKDDQRTKKVAKFVAERMKNAGGSRTSQEQAAAVAFIDFYIRQTPDIIDAVYAAAKKARVLESLSPLFNVAFEYWSEESDFIPDHVGLLGLADDAYLSQHLMEVASNLVKQQTGRSLLDVDLGTPNQLMRGVLGEQIGSQLDAIVGQTIAAQMIQMAFQQLSGFGAMLPLAIGNWGGGSGYTNFSDEANLRLAAMGGPLPY